MVKQSILHPQSSKQKVVKQPRRLGFLQGLLDGLLAEPQSPQSFSCLGEATRPVAQEADQALPGISRRLRPPPP